MGQVGVELDLPRGRNDGSIVLPGRGAGRPPVVKRYFMANRNHGVFATLASNRVTVLLDDDDSDDEDGEDDHRTGRHTVDAAARAAAAEAARLAEDAVKKANAKNAFLEQKRKAAQKMVDERRLLASAKDTKRHQRHGACRMGHPRRPSMCWATLHAHRREPRVHLLRCMYLYCCILARGYCDGVPVRVLQRTAARV